ncbi:MAG: DUF1206 domain-containing protein [Thermoanaerobaculia bacterium]
MTLQKEAAPWVERLARLGYASIGAVYIIVGILAAGTALGRRGRTTDSRSAFNVIMQQPFGRTLMWIVVAGLLGYAIWRFSSAFLDSERRGSDPKGLAIRAGSFFRGAAYCGIAIEAMRIATRSSKGGGSDSSAEHWTARLLAAPFGRVLVIAAALGIAGYAFYQLYRAWSSKLGKQLHLGSLSQGVRRAVIAISRFGIAARAVIFLMISVSIGEAALDRNAEQADGTAGALREIASYGNTVLAIIAVGLISYGIYQLLNARYRTIRAA